MKTRTTEEIVSRLKEIWAGEDKDHYEKVTIKVVRNESDRVDITVHRMYDAPPLSFKILKDISEFFETDNIRDDDFAHGGCATCDWGSKYGFDLYIKP